MKKWNHIYNYDWRDRCPIVQDKHSHLLKSGKLSDVVFLVGENEVPIHAHKFILMVASPVFEIQFSERWNKEDEIQIPDVTPKAFEVFLQFMYTDEFSVTEEEAEDVLSLAHKYMIKSLAKDYSKLLGSLMKVSNVINIYRIATKFGTVEESLQTKAMEFILKNGNAVMKDDGFLQIDHDTLSRILENDKLRADEIIVFRALMRWAENKCKVEKLDCTVQMKRMLLKDLIHLIRFTWITPQDFTNEVSCGKHEGILSDAESFAIFKHLCAGPSVRFCLTRRLLLLALPFNVNKRHSRGLLHKINIQEDGSENYKIAHHGHGRYHDVTETRCETTFQFRSNQSICIKAIEFRQSIYLCSLNSSTRYLVLNESESVSSEIFVSMSLSEGNDTLTGIFLPHMAPNFDSLNGFRIEEDKNYNMKLVIGKVNIGGSTDVSSPGVGLNSSNPVKELGPAALMTKLFDGVEDSDDPEFPDEDLQISFTTYSSKCHRGGQRLLRPSDCICSGQIRTIYFTL